jgi:hypothetical protein
MFQTDEAWEAVSASVVIQRILDQPGLRQYSMIEMAANTQIYHLLILVSGEGSEMRMWNRYMCADLKTVHEIISTDGIVEERIYEQSTWSEGGAFTVTELVKIDRAFVQGHYLYFATAGDGSIRTDRRGEALTDLDRQSSEGVWTLKPRVA